MTENALWKELYKAAMLEVDRIKLHKRIEAAYAAMRQRAEELSSQPHGSGADEQRAIADALHSLRMLQKVEFRSSTETDSQGQAPLPRN